MIVAPCTMKTLSGIALSYSDNLLLRAADVTLKDRRPLVLVPRETPLHLGHLRLMVQVTEMGAIVAPPLPAFYHRPQNVDDIINQTVNRLLDILGITLPRDLFQRWQERDGNMADVRAQALDACLPTSRPGTQGDDGPWAAAAPMPTTTLTSFSCHRARAATPVTSWTGQGSLSTRTTAIGGPFAVFSSKVRRQSWKRRQGTAISRYRRRFPFVATASELAEAFARVSWFRLRPARLYFIDNSKGFGHRDEVRLR